MHDLIIIGGGIHGAAVAHAASQQGLRVLVLEQYAHPGLATSSKSSKLIHGGLRYLETAQFKLVRECLEERSYLLATYPDLVRLVPFHIPVYTNTSRRPWKIRLGLALYTLFSRKGFHNIKRSRWSQLDGLKTNNLQNVFQYYDAQTDDKKLTRRVMQDAIALGAELITHAQFESANCSDDSCEVQYHHAGETCRVAAKLLINCAGPWVNEILDCIHPRPTKRNMELVLGTHIIVPGKLHQGMYYLEAPQDKRAVFVMPWQDNTLIGTTESPATEPHNPIPPDADIEYLITVHNHYFSRQLIRSQILDAFAGLRVLPVSQHDNSNIFSRPRDTIIHFDDLPQPRVFSLYGGKLTAHRATARQLMQVIASHL
jgi:glycerol-3-phosphate dehydrogenase